MQFAVLTQTLKPIPFRKEDVPQGLKTRTLEGGKPYLRALKPSIYKPERSRGFDPGLEVHGFSRTEKSGARTRMA